MPDFDIARLFSFDHLFDTTPGPISVLYAIPAAILIVTFVLSFYINLRRRDIYNGHALHMRVARIFTNASMTVSGIGILLVVARALEMDWLSTRVLLYLDLLALIALFAYFQFYYMRLRYPEDLAYYNEEERKRRYIPPGALPTPAITMRRRAPRRR